MTGKRILPPTTRKLTRSALEPIGQATSKLAAARSGLAIVSLTKRAGTLLVLVDPRGGVHPFPRNSDRARSYAAEKPDWVVGVFNRDAAPRDVAEAILTTFEQLTKVPA